MKFDMKLNMIALFLVMTAASAMAEFRTWTNAEGQQAELELYAVKEYQGEKYGEFRMKNGRTTKLRSSQLSADDAKYLAEWKPNAPEDLSDKNSANREGDATSVFERHLEGNLVKLESGKLKRHKEHSVPSKYYVFYYTAYWCPPCRAFTPSLVDWYEKNKNDNFELVLISSDRDEASMEKYAKEKKMPWPQLSLDKTQRFKGAHNHGVRGIPSLIVCDLEGKMLGNYRSKLNELTEMVR